MSEDRRDWETSLREENEKLDVENTKLRELAGELMRNGRPSDSNSNFDAWTDAYEKLEALGVPCR